MPATTARSGALAFWDELPRDGRWLLSTVVVQFFGRGLTLPFTIIYLHEVRGFPLGLSGTLMGLIAITGLVITGPAGVLVDRLGARVVVVGGLLAAMAGLGLLAFATVPWVAAVALCLFGIQLGVAWPAINALVATVVTGDLRQRYYGVSFALLNLGIGVGGVVGGLLMDVDRPATFVVAFTVNAACFVPALVVQLGPLRHLHGRAARPGPDDVAAPSVGYLAILRTPAVAWLTVLALLASFVGYGQMEAGFPAFARQASQVSTRVVGFAFVVNTVVIVALQFWVMGRARGRRRTRVLAVMALVWAVAWLTLGATGLAPGTVLAVVGVLAFHALFGFGETMLQSTMPAVLNDLAPDHLRGRYNAMQSAAFQVGSIVGPIAAGFLLEHHLSAVFIAVVVAGCVAMLAVLAVLERTIHPEANGVAAPSPAPSPETA
ncbi:major facilitator superfamily MFS_1 [Xylanimonas cellulosilytica DSM 15894]|uniref:Major facilitator superfamily MFS_1 n=1 Tax=Xylanimonas cellulosilytica (strain DSM 15894 / JCM 12276 / CECT 5975 / KCTC 9989 / LMG 20990 / NBRC 107835 / XIL07) TaxID=446471 RepID=D1BV18_XYLCX|nr:MFS transporter [Xylanimonas cellulosilytica]ACZ31257.1 major facilitator superfamily MFS_1 [Xylanimonas cellulosilytica DSM 15894]